IQDLPPGVLFAFTVQDDPGYEAIHDCGVPHVPLRGMRGRDIQEMGQKRFDLAISDATAALLEETAGDPFSLVACFNALRRRNLAPSAENIEALLREEEDPAGLAVATLPRYWQTWARDLALLIPPFPVPVMACMLGMPETDVTLMVDRLQESAVFKRLPGGAFAFAHPLLQEHCRDRLPEDAEVALNARAADCFERFMHRLPGRLNVLLSIASHLFGARDYARAADLNLELGLRFYHRGDYDSALMLTERAVTAAERLGNDALLAAAVSQRDRIREEMVDRA
ncbi:MAG: ATP-binding protein, partial [Methanomicrobiales archaeon]|nr:ATP-binding protein [Methanomicrobiales archaeon]